jgi:hypothetical protein
LARARAYGSQLHLVAYTDKEPTSIVTKAKAREVDSELDEADPPRDANYMDGEAFVAVRDNHVLICAIGSGVSDNKLAQFIGTLAMDSGVSKSTISISFERVADAKEIDLIAKHGVKAIGLNASMDEGSLHRTHRTQSKSPRDILVGGVADRFMALVMKDGTSPDSEAAEIEAHLDAEVIIRVDRWGRGKISQEKLNELATLAVEEDDPGVRIVLTDDTVITGSHIAAHKYFSITRKAKGLSRADALEKIDAYFNELKADAYFYERIDGLWGSGPNFSANALRGGTGRSPANCACSIR